MFDEQAVIDSLLDEAPEEMAIIASLCESFRSAITGEEHERPFFFRSRSIQDFLEDPISQKLPFIQFTRWFEARLDQFFAVLLDSPTFSAMLAQCPEIYEVPVLFHPLGDESKAGALYSNGNDAVVVDHEPDRDDFENDEPSFTKLMYIIHEFRHAFHAHHIAIHPYRLARSPVELLSNSFVQEAEVNAFQATVCWELKENGHPEYWHAFKAHSYGLARAFESAIEDDPKALSNGKAQEAVFNAWFESQSKVDFYTQECIDNLKGKRLNLNIQFPDRKKKGSSTPLEAKNIQQGTPKTTALCPFYIVKTENPYLKAACEHGLMPYLNNDGTFSHRNDYLQDPTAQKSDLAITLLVSGEKLVEIGKLMLDQVREAARKAATQASP